MVSKRFIPKVFSIILLFALLVGNAGLSGVIAQSSTDEGTGNGGNPVVIDDSAPSLPPKLDKADLDPNQTIRYIVKLEDAPLADYDGGVNGLMATSVQATNSPRLNVNTPAAVAYEGYLAGKQNMFANTLAKSVPGAKIEHQYRVILNAVTVKARVSDAQTLRKLPGVKAVAPEREYKLEMDTSLPLIGLGSGDIGNANWVDSGLWDAVGGHENAGAGIKIADIDSGITPENPCFDPGGFIMPSGFPKGETGLTNAKIIAARSYFRLDDPPFFPASARDDPAVYEGGHGTHTAGTMACNYGTVSTFGETSISGVAPKAQLMVYRVFYYSVDGSLSAYTPEIVAAIEDAVRDGADVVNNSWGGSNWNATTFDPEVEAFEAAVEAGVVIVFSAGNSGDSDHTVGSPGSNSDKFITVGAANTQRIFGNPVSITGPGTVAANLTNIAGMPGSGPKVTTDINAPIKYNAANLIGCNSGGAFPADYFEDSVALILRGTCNFSEKVENATDAGAIGVIVYNNSADIPFVMGMLETTTVPSVMIDQSGGTAIKSFIDLNPSATVEIKAVLNQFNYPSVEDTLASFSSRGPTPDMKIKPDLTAPGVNILSSVSPLEYGSTVTTFELYQGTSMAAPHVTGAAALMRQIHPDWTPAQIKSSLVTTAEEPAALGTDPTQRGAGRLDLTSPHEVELVFDQSSLSFGLLEITTPEEPTTITVAATNTTDEQVVYDVTVTSSAGGDTPVIQVNGSPATSITVPADGSVNFDVVLTPTTDGAAYGKVILTDQAADSPTLHLPYWTYRITEVTNAIYLVDGDYSEYDLGCPDVSSFYEDALTALAIDYTYVPFAAFDIYEAQAHSAVIYFDGPPNSTTACGGNLSAYGDFFGDQLRSFLAQGGRMLLMGQDVAVLDSLYYYFYGTTFNPIMAFGFEYVQDNVGTASDLVVSNGWEGNDWLDGTVIQLDPATAVSVDEVYPGFFDDIDALPLFKIANAPSKIAPDGAYVGTRMSSEETIERVKDGAPWFPAPYRTLFTSFGLEDVAYVSGFGINDEPEDMLLALLDWLEAETEVIVEPGYYSPQPDIAVELYAAATTTNGPIAYYRFDFGDGSPIVELMTSDDTAFVNHKYPDWGTYTAYIEAVDIFGHSKVTTANVTIGNRLYLPILGR